MKYSVPANYYFRIHHIRSRFKNDVEDVLLFMANEISKIPELNREEFKRRLNRSVRLFPGNAIKEQKTIDNWRTEISALFGFIQENYHTKSSRPGKIALKLAEEQDLIQFFKYFLFYFQYPGGHIKSHKVKELIDAGVKFKPAQYILKVLEQGERITGQRYFINKAEATHCIFNDLRVTRDQISPTEVVSLIVNNRERRIQYDWAGDVIRYAGDILDYMLIANLLTQHGNNFYINWGEREAVTSFLESSSWFAGYDHLFSLHEYVIPDNIENDWFDYVNTDLAEELFKTDVLKYLGVEEADYETLIKESIREFETVIDGQEGIRTKDIGDFGENLVLGHEFMRIKIGGREDLLHLIKKIPTALAVGYDIQSVELDERKRLIEVKTTISRKQIHFFNVHLTPNEWKTAESVGRVYYIYRLTISHGKTSLFILNDPVELYRNKKIAMTIRDGADIIFTEEAGNWTELLIWKN